MATSSGKEHLSIVICGHASCGKSTTMGHFLYQLGSQQIQLGSEQIQIGIDALELERLMALADGLGKPSFVFAYYFGGCLHLILDLVIWAMGISNVRGSVLYRG